MFIYLSGFALELLMTLQLLDNFKFQSVLKSERGQRLCASEIKETVMKRLRFVGKFVAR